MNALALPRRHFLLAGAVAALSPAALVPLSSHAEAFAAASAPVAALDDGLLAIMKAGKGASFDQRMRTLSPVVEQAFDLGQILRTSVGPKFASFAPDQQSELLATFRDFITASYVANFDVFSGERFEISPETRKFGNEDVVQTRIVPTSGDPTRLDYVVRPEGGSFKIVDVLLDGSISRVAVQRSDFRSFLTGGDPAPLIAMLRTKVAGLAAGNKE